MKRSRLRRLAPLRSGKPLERHSPLREVSAQRATTLPPSKRPKNTGPDRTTRATVFERDGGCVICGRGPYGLQIHHRKPRRMGGRSDRDINAPANLASLCSGCHAWTESNRAEALDMGLLLHEYEDPEQVPMLHDQFGAVFLLDDGTVRLVPHVDGAA